MNSTLLDKLISEVEAMLPLLNSKPGKAVASYVNNIEWNLKKLKGRAGSETITADEWLDRSIADFGNLALALNKGESGHGFADTFDERAEKVRTAATPPPATPQPAANPDRAPVASAATPQSPVEQTPAPTAETTAAQAAPAPPPPPFNVRAHLAGLASEHAEKLAWKTSVVDLMKLIGLSSSLPARKALARELGWRESEIASVGSEEGNENLRVALIASLAENNGTLGVDPSRIA